jgi:hypothetical protein
MFEKIGNMAEKLATNVSESRRGFLVRLGKAALSAAGVMGGLLVLSGEASAANICVYGCPDGSHCRTISVDCPLHHRCGGMTCQLRPYRGGP